MTVYIGINCRLQAKDSETPDRLYHRSTIQEICYFSEDIFSNRVILITEKFELEVNNFIHINKVSANRTKNQFSIVDEVKGI